MPPRHPTVTNQQHVTLCFEPRTTEWLPLLGTRCTLRVEVLPTSRSGEHELKLYSISLKDAGS